MSEVGEKEEEKKKEMRAWGSGTLMWERGIATYPKHRSNNTEHMRSKPLLQNFEMCLSKWAGGSLGTLVEGR